MTQFILHYDPKESEENKRGTLAGGSPLRQVLGVQGTPPSHLLGQTYYKRYYATDTQFQHKEIIINIVKMIVRIHLPPYINETERQSPFPRRRPAQPQTRTSAEHHSTYTQQRTIFLDSFFTLSD